MLWDSLILIAAIALAIAGWNIGLINSWRSPLAVIIATIVTQQYYVDFSTWIVQQTLMPPDKGSLLGYLMLWIVTEIVAELLLNLILPWNRHAHPNFFNRAGGALLGIAKCAVALICPLLVLQSPPKIPAPPQASEPLIKVFESGFDESQAVKKGSELAKELAPSLSSLVISNKAPSFKPKFHLPPPPEKKKKPDDIIDEVSN